MIKFVFRWAFRLVLLAMVLAIGLLLLKDNIARNLTEDRIRRDTGFDTRIGKLEFSLFSPRVSLENVVMVVPATGAATTVGADEQIVSATAT